MKVRIAFVVVLSFLACALAYGEVNRIGGQNSGRRHDRGRGPGLSATLQIGNVGITLGGRDCRQLLPTPVQDAWGNWYQPTPGPFGWVLVPIPQACAPQYRGTSPMYNGSNYGYGGGFNPYALEYRKAYQRSYHNEMESQQQRAISNARNAGSQDGRNAARQQPYWGY